jgi:hypothetical protein
MGILKLGDIGMDGTKIKANASKHKAMSWEYAGKLEAQLRGEVEELIKRAEADRGSKRSIFQLNCNDEKHGWKKLRKLKPNWNDVLQSDTNKSKPNT